MFFIIVALICLIAIIIIFIATRVQAIIRLEHKCLHLDVDWLLLRIRREYCIERDEDRVLALYRQMGEREKKVTTLTEILFTEKPERNTSLFKLIRLAAQSREERQASTPWFTIIGRGKLDLRLNAAIGTGDAYATAMTCGLLISVGSALCAVASTKGRNLRLFVRPVFDRQSFSLYGNCIIAVTPANIILGYFIYKIRSRGKKHASD